MTAGFRREVDEISALLCYYAEYSGYSLPTFRVSLSVPSSKAKKSKKERRESRITWPFKMGPIGCPETSARNYHYTLRNIPEDLRPQLNSSSYHQSLSRMSSARSSWWKLFVRICVPVANDRGKANVNNWNCARRAVRLGLFKYFRSIKNKPFLLAALWRRWALVLLETLVSARYVDL